MLPPSLDDWLPEDHLARFVAELVDGVLDLSAIYADCSEARGHLPYDPRLMVRLLVYGYSIGVRSSRAIERRCVDDVAFRFLAAGCAPDFRPVARLRRRHLDALADLFVQSLRLTQRLGMVTLGRVALDGTKLRANAPKHKAMSYGRLVTSRSRRGGSRNRSCAPTVSAHGHESRPMAAHRAPRSRRPSPTCRCCSWRVMASQICAVASTAISTYILWQSGAQGASAASTACRSPSPGHGSRAGQWPTPVHRPAATPLRPT